MDHTETGFGVGRVKAGFLWLRIGTSGGLLLTQ
jgi:hypothetical protein